jgi:protease II
MAEEAYSLWMKSSEFKSPILRYGYSSLTTPMWVWDGTCAT